VGRPASMKSKKKKEGIDPWKGIKSKEGGIVPWKGIESSKKTRGSKKSRRGFSRREMESSKV